MKFIQKYVLVLAVLAAMLLSMTGCGGSSGSASGGGGGTATNSLLTFVSDDLTTAYDHVWVTFYSIDLTKDDGTTVNIFASTAGQQVDLSTLTDGTNPIYLFLGQNKIPSGTYKGFTLTFGKTVTLYAKGATTSTTATFPASLDSTTAGQSKITRTFDTAKTFNDGDSFHIDCVLKNWTVVGGVLTPDIKEGSGAGIGDKGHHEKSTVVGKVSALGGTAPTQTFTLTGLGDDDRTLNVTTDATTVIVSSDASSSPSLANDENVEVKGQFDPTTKTFAATNIVIRVASSGGGSGGGSAPKDLAEGTPTTTDSSSATGLFDLTVKEAHGFIPVALKVHVQLTSSSKLFTNGGVTVTQDQFIAALTSGAVVGVEGVYDSTTNTLTADSARAEVEGSTPPEIGIQGAVTAVTASTGFTINLVEWEGFHGTTNLSVNIVTNSSTQYVGLNGEPLTADQFFAAAMVGTVVEVKGKLTGTTTITADAARLRQAHNGDGGDKAEVFGIPANVTSTGFDVVLLRWNGFDAKFHDTEHLAFTDTTEYRTKNGEVVTKDQFLTLVNGDQKRSVAVEGSFSSGTITVARIRQNK